MRTNSAGPHKRCFLLLLALGAVACLFAACSGAKAPSKPSEKQYQVSGVIEGLNPKLQTATVNAAAIPGWMEAMTMEFPIRSKSDFEKLHVSDRITATVNVRGTDYDLTNIHWQNSSPQ
jgi:Cu/Ag efflux protein CusF